MELPVSYRGIELRSKGSRVDRLGSKTKDFSKDHWIRVHTTYS